MADNYNLFLSLLLGMIFLHILDDFVLQSFSLAKLKQKKTWERYCEGKPERLSELYRHDYIVALSMHGISWAICIFLPWIVMFGSKMGGIISILVVINAAIHSFIDHQKANNEMINLFIDQAMHMLQIIGSWFILCEYYIIFEL